MRPAAFLLAFAALVAAPAAAQEEILVLVTDVWRTPIANARIYDTSAPQQTDTPLAESGEDGRCTIAAQPGTFITVDHPRFAPLVHRIEATDLERGYVTAILYKGGSVQGTVRVGGQPFETDYLFLQYADPLIFGGRIQSRSGPDGVVRFNNAPEGLAYLSAGARVDGALRTTTIPVQVVNESNNYIQLGIDLGTAGVRGRVIGPDGEPAAAVLNGTLIARRNIEEIATETDPDGAYELTRLPERPLVLRAQLPGGLLKRADIPLENDTVLERDIRFDRDATIDVTVQNAPNFDWLDVFLLDADVDVAQIRDRTDRATYLRAARVARIEAQTAQIAVHGVPNGRFTLLALATRLHNGRTTTTVSEFATIEVSEDAPFTIRFPAAE